MKKHLQMLALMALLCVPWVTQAQLNATYNFATGVDTSKWYTLTDESVMLLDASTFATSETASTGDSKKTDVADIGFAFNFAGVEYTHFSANSDGTVRLGDVQIGTGSYSSPFSSTNANSNNPKICGLGCDGCMVLGDYIAYQLFGTVGNRVAVIEISTGTYNSTTRANHYTFQVQLAEADNSFSLVYSPVVPAAGPNVNYQIGACVNSTDIVLFNVSDNTMIPLTAGTTTVNNALGTWPDAGRYYTLTPNPDACFPVTGLTATNISSTGATLQWNDNNNSGATYTVYDWSNSPVATQVSGFSYTLSGLEANTPYTYSVTANCSVDNGSNFVSVNFRTACSTFDIPHTWTFEDEDISAPPACWTKLGSGLANVLSNTSYSYDGSQQYLRFSGSTSNLVVLPNFYEEISNLQLRFWTRPESNTNTSCGTFSVGYLTDMDDETSFVEVANYLYSDFSGYQEKTVNFANAPAGAHIAMRHNAASTSWYWFVDNVTVEPLPNCVAVTATVSEVTPNSVTLSWTDGLNSNATYTVYNMDDGTMVASGITGNSYTVTNLLANTHYTFGVQANCPNDDASWSSVNVRTACDAIVSLPYVMSFEEEDLPGTASALAFPYCWSRINTVASGTYTYYPYSSTSNAYSGNRKLYFYGYNSTSYADTTGFILPALDVTTYPMNGNRLTFWANVTSSTPYVLYVGTLTNPADLSAFTLVDSVVVSGTTYTKYAVPLTTANATDAYVAVIVPKVSATMYMDDVTLEVLPSCMEVVDVTAAVAAHSATLAWNDYNPAATYTLYYIGEYDDPLLLTSNISATTYTVTGLEANTDYTFGVQANCATSDAPLTTVTLHTACDNEVMPFVEDFSETLANDPCWNGVNGVTADDVFAGAPLTLGANNAWTYSSTTSNGLEAGHYRANIYSTSCQRWMVTPLIDLSNASSAQLSFDAAFTKYSGTAPAEGFENNESQAFMVIVSTDGGNTWLEANATKWQNAGGQHTLAELASTEYINQVISLNQYLGQTVRIAFYAQSTVSGGDNNIHIDNIVVSEVPACAAVSNLHVGEVSSNSVTLAWSDLNNDGAYYTVRDMNSNAVLGTVYDTLFVATGLAPTTTYIFGVQANCNDSAAASIVTTTATTTFAGENCYITIAGADSFGDGWNGNAINVTVDSTLVATFTLASGSNYTENILVPAGQPLHFIWTSGSYADEASFSIFNANGDEMFAGNGSNFSSGELFYTMPDCNTTPAYDTLVATACDSYTWNGVTYTASGTYVSGTSSLLLTINYSTYTDEYAEAIGSYYWYGNTYTQSGTYTHYGVNAVGCDSVITLHLTIPIMCGNDMAVTVSNADTSASLTTSYFPGYSVYNYSYSEVIVPAAQLQGIVEIKGMEFDVASIGAGSSLFNDCEIYLMNTTAQTLDAGFIQDTDNFQLVYAGSLNQETTGSYTVTFSNSFGWNGTDNLLVAVRRNTGSWASGSSFAAFPAGASLGRYIYTDNAPYTIGAISGGNATSTVPVYRFLGCGACHPNPSSVDFEGITNVTFGGMTNTVHPTSAGYADYSSMSGSVPAGTNATVDITYSTGYTYGTIIWVDWNNNSLFEGDEVVYVGNSDNARPTTLSASFYIPATQPEGNYRMRIVGADYAFDSYITSIEAAANADPCLSGYSYGVAEDYTLTVTAVPSCMPIQALAVNDISDNSVTLAWEGSANSYTVYNLNDSTVVASGITTTSYTVTGLSPLTNYTFGVTANCSATDESMMTSLNVRTACGAMTVPFTLTFEEDVVNATPDCWTKIGTGTVKVTTGSCAYNSSKGLHFSGTTSNLILLPETAEEISNLQLRFWTRPESYTNSSCGSFSVGYMIDDTTFVEQANYVYNEFSSFEEKTVNFIGAPADARMAMRHNANSSSWYWYVDDVTVEILPTCLPITGLTAQVAQNTVTLSWDDTINSGATYMILDMNTGAMVANGITGTTYTVGGLEYWTNYTFGVVAACSVSDISAVRTVSALTDCAGDACNITIVGTDSFGDGWNGHAINIHYGDSLYTSFTLANGSSYKESMCFGINVPLSFSWTTGSYPSEVNFEIYNNSGSIIYSNNGSNMVGGRTFLYMTDACSDSGYVPVYHNINLTYDASMGTVSGGGSYLADDPFTVEAYPYDGYSFSQWNLYDIYGNFVTSSTDNPWTYYAYDDYNVEAVLYEIDPCYPPTDLVATDITSSSFTVSWTPSGNANDSLWRVYMNGDEYITSNTSYTFTNLAPGTHCTVAVSSLCSNGKESGALTLDVRTTCTDNACQLTIVGTDSYGDGWNGNAINIYYGDSLYATFTLADGSSYQETWCLTGNVPLEFSWTSGNWSYEANFQIISNNSVSIYSNNGNSMTNGEFFLSMPDACSDSIIVPEPPVYYTINLTSNNGMGNLYGDGTYIAESSVTVEAYPYDGYYFSSWEVYDADGNYLTSISDNPWTFYANNNYNIQAIFNEYDPCYAPSDLVVTDVTSNSFTVSWTPNSNDSSWVVYLNGNGIVTYEASYTFTDLTPNTYYNVGVAAVCTYGNLTETVYTDVRTSCTALTLADLPYFTSFENEEMNYNVNLPYCWNRINNGQYSYPNVSQYGSAHTGNNALYFYNYPWSSSYYGDIQIALLPVLDATIDLSTLRLRFFARSNYGNAMIEVGTMSDPADISTFTSLSTYELTQNGYNQYKFSSFTNTTDNYIAFRMTADTVNYNTQNIYIDDVTLELIPTCMEIADLTVSNPTNSSLTLSWVDTHNSGATYAVYNMADYTMVASGITANSYTVTGLVPNTNYTFAVAASCSAGDTSLFETANGRTTCAEDACTLTIAGTDSYGDGWNGNAINIFYGDTLLDIFTLTYDTPNSYEQTWCLGGNMPLSFTWTNGSWTNEADFQITGNSGAVLYSNNGDNVNNGDVFLVMPDACSDSIIVTEPQVVYTINVSYGWEGYAYGGGNYIANDPFTVQAYAYDGYVFDHWNLYDANWNLILSATDNPWTYYAYDNYNVEAVFSEVVSAAEIPYYTSFEYYEDNAWELVDGNNHWTIGEDSNAVLSGSRALYISDGYDGAYNYNISNPSWSYATRLIHINNYAEYLFSFDWKAYGEGNYDYLRAWVAPNGISLQANVAPDGTTTSTYNYPNTTPEGWIDLNPNGGRLNLNSEWSNNYKIVYLEPGYYNLVFLWCNDGSVGTMPPAAVDNVSISQVVCSAVTDLYVSDVTPTSVSLAWNDYSNDGATYTVTVDGMEVATNVTGNYYTVTGLNEFTTYNFGVTANCSGNENSLTTYVSTTTPEYCANGYCNIYVYAEDNSGDGWNGNSINVMRNNNVAYYYSMYEGSYDTATIAVCAGQPISFVWNRGNNPQDVNFTIANADGVGMYAANGNGLYSGDWFFSIDSCNVDASVYHDTTYVSACDSYIWIDGVTYDVSGVYSNGVNTLNLTVNYTQTIDTVVVNMEGVVWEGNEYNSTGVYTQYYMGSNGCDSIRTLHLTIGHSAADVTCDNGEVVTVNNAEYINTTIQYIPAYSYYNYSYSEVIIPAEQLVGIGAVKALQFKPATTTAGNYFTNCEVYMANTDQEDLSNGFIQDTSLFQLVWTGDMNHVTTDWQTLLFDETFNWDGSSNVVVAVRRNHGSYTNGSQFEAYTENSQLARYIYQDSGPYTIGSIYGGTATNIVPLYKLVGCEGTSNVCHRVTNLTVNEVTTNSINVSWTAGADESVWFVSLNGTGYYTSTPSYTFTDLTSNTPYTVQVVAVCNAGSESHPSTVNVRTGCAALTLADLPYSTSFEAEDCLGESSYELPTCWTRYNNGTSNNYYPYCSSSTTYAHSGTMTLYFYSSNYYYYADTMMAVLPVLDASVDLSTLRLRFYARSNNNASFEIGTLSDPTDASSFTSLQTYANIMDMPIEYKFSSFVNTTDRFIAFRVLKDSITYHSLYIDDMVLEPIPTCMEVAELSVTNVTDNSVTLAWVDETNSNATYTVYNLTDGTTVASGLIDTTYTVENLLANTNYTFAVEVNCAANDASLPVSVSIRTLINPVMCGDEEAMMVANSYEATGTTSYFPGYSYYNYSYSEVIVPAEQLQGISEIKGMQFNVTTVAAGSTYFNNCEIYLMNTSAESLSNGFIQDTANFQLVYTGDLNHDYTGWYTVIFQNNFLWNGTDNLLVAVRRNNGSYTTNGNFASYQAGADLGRYIYQDSGPYTIGAISGGNSTSNVPVYQFLGCEEQQVMHTITVVYDSTMGYATGGGEYNSNSFFTVEAFANEGYYFERWMVYNSDNEYIGYVTNYNPWTYYSNDDYTVEAVFSPVTTLTFDIAVNDSTMGSTFPAPGTYQYLSGSYLQMEAIANEGYVFGNWTVTYLYDSVPTTETFDYNPISFLVRNSWSNLEQLTFTANFSADTTPAQYTIYATCDTTMGYVTGGGIYYANESFTVAAYPYEGYHFVQWNVYGNNGEFIGSIDITPFSTYADNNYVFVAEFEANGVTNCNPVAIPFYEGFENGIDCWTVHATSSNTGLAYSPYEGNADFAFSYSTNPPQYLISPMLTGTGNGVQVEFFYKIQSTYYPESFQLGYSTTTNDTSAFVWGEELTNLINTSYEHYVEILNVSDIKYVAIKYTAYDMYMLHIDNFVVRDIPTCLPVTELTAVSETGSTATLTWSDSVTAGATYTVYDMTTGTVIASGITANSHTVTGLTASTVYTFGVAANCSDDETSDIVTVSLRTACAAGTCNITIAGTDSYGDGWNGNAINVYYGDSLYTTFTLTNGGEATETWCLGGNVPLSFSWTSGSWSSEADFQIIGNNGTVIYSNNGSNMTDGEVFLTLTDACSDSASAPVQTYTVTVVYDTTMAYVTGGGVYEAESAFTLAASPFDGYQFARWEFYLTDGTYYGYVTDNPFTYIAYSDYVVQAVFEPIDTVTVVIAVNNPVRGTTTPAAGTYQYVENSVFTAEATANEGFLFDYWVATYTYDGVLYADTLAGSSLEMLVNYSWSDLSPITFTAHFSGNCNPMVVNIVENACDSYEWNGLSITNSGLYSYTFSTEAGCDSTVNLYLNIGHTANVVETVMACDSYTWHGTVYTSSTDTATYTYSINGCDSTVTLHLTLNSSNSTVETVAACDSYTWHGTVYTSSTNAPFHTYTNADGCDSTVTLNLTVNHGTTGDTVAEACGSFDWYEYVGMNASQNVTRNFTAANGCDSTVTLHLTVNQCSSTEATACNLYVWKGNVYTSSGTYIDGYDTLMLTINRNTNGDTVVATCGSFDWYEYSDLTASQNITHTLQGANVYGCDSIVTLHLTINQCSTTEAVACESYLWKGKNYASSGIYTVGYDTLILTINHSITGDTVASACNGFTWYGNTYTTSSNPTHIFTASNGCDSTVTLHLTVNNCSDTTVTACNSYTWHNITLTNSGTYQFGYETLHLTIINSAVGDTFAIACNEFNWYDHIGMTTTQSVSHTFSTSGCDSIVTLHLIVRECHNVDTTACGSYTWKGFTFSSTGVYVIGNDTLNLTINQPNYGDELALVMEGQTYSWHNNVYSTTTNVTDTLPNANIYGCDSIVTLHLFVISGMNPSKSAHCDTVDACESYVWTTQLGNIGPITSSGTYTLEPFAHDTLVLTIHHGTTTETAVDACNSYTWYNVDYNETQTVSHVIADQYGCDSTETLHLTINQCTDTTVVACDNYFWHGLSLNNSGVYGYDFDTLRLTINHSRTGDTIAEACNSFSWYGDTYVSSDDYTHTFVSSNQNGCDSTVTLHLTVNQCSITEVAACNSYTWNGQTYTSSGTYVDGYNTLALTINRNTSGDTVAEACNSFMWNGELKTESGEYTYQTVNTLGCDSTVTLHLTVNQCSTTEATACEQYTWHGDTYNSSNTYTDGHDTLMLTIVHSMTNDTTAVACNTFSWYEHENLTASQNVTHTFAAANNCDSTVTLHLTVNNCSTTEANACDSYTWRGNTYTSSGTYNDGYDTLMLTIKHSTTSDTNAVVCNTFSWYEYTNRTVSQDVSHVFTAANECDSTVTLHLTVRYSSTGSETVTACDSYTWNGSTYYADGVYDYLTTNADGCDSTVTLNLTVNASGAVTTTETACDSYTWNGTTYTTGGTYTYGYLGSNGCQVIATLNLTLNNSSTAIETVTACDSYDWHGTTYMASTNTPTYTTTNDANCDSTVTLHLTINNGSTAVETVTACDSYNWHGTTYTASTDTPTYTTTNAANCDSTVTLHLTINNGSTAVETVTACDSYTWHGTTYTASTNTPTYTTTNAANCDSTVTLHLTINTGSTAVETVTACDSYTWHGTTYTTSTNTPTYTTTNAANCDSTVTLHLTINVSNSAVETVTACDSYTWHGTTYTASTDTPTYTTTNAANCDSTVTLHLTINYGSNTEEDMAVCDEFTWNGTNYTVSTVITEIIANANGCNDTTTINFTVNYSVVVYDTVTVNSSSLPFDYNGQSITQAGDYQFDETTNTGCDSTIMLHVNVTTGIADIVNLEEVSVYPNPTHGMLNITADNVVKVEILDAVGRLVATYKNTNRLDLSNLAEGSYALRITLPQGMVIRKVIKR